MTTKLKSIKVNKSQKNAPKNTLLLSPHTHSFRKLLTPDMVKYKGSEILKISKSGPVFYHD